MIFNITPQVPVLFGDGAAKQTGEKAAQFGWKKVICVYDNGVKTAGIVDQILESLDAAGIEYVEYGGVIPEPPDYIAEEAAEVARKAKVDGTIGVGGGSSLDVAKAVNLLMAYPSPVNQYWFQMEGLNPPKEMILIPTTAGTGSEMSIGAVLTDTRQKMKVFLFGPHCFPKLAIIDPSLTLSLPAGITAQTAIDAFSHAYESYTGVQMNPMCDMYCEKTMELDIKYLPVAIKDPRNYKAREALIMASMLGAMSLTDSMAHLGHAFAHAIGHAAHIAHGIGCGLSTIILMEYLGDILPEKTRRVGELLGLELAKDLPGEELGKQVSAGFAAFLKKAGMPTTLSEAGVSESKLEEIANAVAADMLQNFSHKKADAKQALALLKKIFR